MPREEDIFDVVQQVQALALDDSGWNATLDSLADLFGATGVSFEIIDKKTGAPTFFELGNRIVNEHSHEYFNYYAAISPRIAFCGNLPVGDIGYDYRILTEAEMDADEYYCDLMAPMGLRYFVSGHVLSTDSHSAVIAAHRSPAQGYFGDEEFALMRRMTPIVQQAMDLRFRLKAQDRQTASFLDGLESLGEAALLIDHGGRVRHMNGTATALLEGGDGVNLVGGAVKFADKAANGDFDSALRSLTTVAGDAVDVAARNFVAHRPSGKRPFLVAVRPLADQGALEAYRQITAIVFLRDPTVYTRLDTDALIQSYRLSAAEIDVAEALDTGATLHEIAQRRGVAISTIRSQLYSLMAKMSVTSQIELTRLLGQYGRAF